MHPTPQMHARPKTGGCFSHSQIIYLKYDWGGQSRQEANVTRRPMSFLPWEAKVFFLGEANVGEANVGEVNVIAPF